MTEKSEENSMDQLIVNHPDGNIEKVPLPAGDKILRIGRELDNDVVLTDPRTSRYHSEIRFEGAVLEIQDLSSANGTLINGDKIEPEIWTKVTPNQEITMAETRITWEKSLSSQSTVVMARQRREDTKVSVVPPRTPPAEAASPKPQAKKQSTPTMTYILGGGAVIAFLIFVVVLILFLTRGSTPQDEQVAQQPGATVTEGQASSTRENTDLNQQSTNVEPTPTPTPSGPQLAIPVVELSELQVSPIIFGASPNTKNAYLFIDVRVRNAGNIPFIFSISSFSLKDRLSGQIFTEAGANTSENYLKQLGAIDRFEGLALTPGGSVPGSLVFETEIGTYDLELVFNAPDVAPVVLGLGTVNMRRELDLAAGTPLAALEGETPAVENTPTQEPTPTATRPAEIPSPVVVSRSALEGTIAFSSFEDGTFNTYLGDVTTGETRFFRAQASQPSFSPDGSRLALHSWDNTSRGLLTMDSTGANPKLIATFAEDQLPAWTSDGQSIVFLTRRSGDRKSNLVLVDSNTEGSEGSILGEGEYPSIGLNGMMLLKGWGNTAFGLRQSSVNMDEIQTITNAETDTAPSLSPDGSKVVFMSRREGENWDIYMVNIDGSDLQRLTRDASQDGLPVWSPDGNAIAFVSDRGGPWAVWVMTPDGKGISQLFTMEGTPDGFVGEDTYASRGWAEERISWTDAQLIE
jgi:TolB protein